MDWSRFPREKTECMLCGASKPLILSVQHTWPVAKCSECGFIYLSERPSERALEDMYGKEYYDGAEVGYGGYEENFLKYNRIFKKLFRRRARDLEPFRGDGRLLEVGCAHGFLLDYLERRGWTTTGVEVSPVAAEYASRRLGLNVMNCTLEKAALPGDSFDVVLLLDVLEHLHRPYDSLAEIGRILKPGGRLVVQCPWELTHWEERAEAFIKGMRQCTITPDAVPAHLYFFDPRTLDAMLAKAGFRIVKRQSGNYGAVRKHVKPVPVDRGNILERAGRLIYFRWGLQEICYGLSRAVGKGNGLIRYAEYTR